MGFGAGTGIWGCTPCLAHGHDSMIPAGSWALAWMPAALPKHWALPEEEGLSLPKTALIKPSNIINPPEFIK